MNSLPRPEAGFFPMIRLPFIVLLATAAGTLLLVRAQEQPPPKPEKKGETKPDEKKPDEKKPEKPEKVEESVETKHQITVGGQPLAYTATAGTLTLTKAYGEPRAKVFFVSYIRTPEEAPGKRPLCFCFNGGPGSSAV